MTEPTRITVYTPTYNRTYRLPDLYESLLRQTNRQFTWLIIDDGSTDDTSEMVSKWKDENRISIAYHYQENKGKQEACNWAHRLLQTELHVCVDSDDYLCDDAIEIILNEWDAIPNKENLAGLVGLDVYRDGSIVGTKFPEAVKTAKFSHFVKLGIRGDKKFVYRSDVIQSYPEYPSINGERFPAPGYLYRLIDQDYDLWLFNKPLCVVEYLPDGISKNKILQLKKNPNAFRFYRYERMRLAIDLKDKLKNTIHFICSSILAGKSVFKGNRYKLTTFFMLPFGFVLYIAVRKTKQKGVI